MLIWNSKAREDLQSLETVSRHRQDSILAESLGGVPSHLGAPVVAAKEVDCEAQPGAEAAEVPGHHCVLEHPAPFVHLQLYRHLSTYHKVTAHLA